MTFTLRSNLYSGRIPPPPLYRVTCIRTVSEINHIQTGFRDGPSVYCGMRSFLKKCFETMSKPIKRVTRPLVSRVVAIRCFFSEQPLPASGMLRFPVDFLYSPATRHTFAHCFNFRIPINSTQVGWKQFKFKSSNSKRVFLWNYRPV